jgi:prepilin-type N-terminal cleavage/methylation domain-containing protein
MVTMDSKRKQNSPDSGFTLVEVLIAAVILAVGLTAVATMIARSTIQDSRAYYMTRASLLMEDFIESNIGSQYNKNNLDNLSDNTFTTIIDGVEYTTTCIIQNDTPIKNTKEMTCTINWNNKGINARSTYVYAFSPKY